MYNFISTEFEILKILWTYEQLSSKEIHEKISPKTDWAYSTTRTVIERMVKKEYLLKDSFHGINVYSAKISKVHAFASQICQFADKILERDAYSLLPLFVKSDALSSEELDELEVFLKSMESDE